MVSDLRHGPSISESQPRLPEPVIGFFRQHDGAPFPVVLAEAYIGYQLAGEATVYPWRCRWSERGASRGTCRWRANGRSTSR